MASKKTGIKYQEKAPELRIQGVSDKTRLEVINIAKHLGVTISTLLRPEISKIIASYPDHMKKPPID
jgi:hypothetical protein